MNIDDAANQKIGEGPDCLEALALLGVIGFIAVLLLLFAGCACLPPNPPKPTATATTVPSGPPTATRTAQPAASPTPTEKPPQTMVPASPVASSTPSRTPTKPATATQTASASPTRTLTATLPPTGGSFGPRASVGTVVWRFDWTEWVMPTPGPAGQLDYFAALTASWDLADPSKPMDPNWPLLEISMRGTVPLPCTASPCGDLMGVVARGSANVNWDAGDFRTPRPQRTPKPENQHCGEGTNYKFRLPVGATVFDVSMSWAPGSPVVIKTWSPGAWRDTSGGVPLGEFHLQRKAEQYAFSRWVPGVPSNINPWARPPWLFANFKGKVTVQAVLLGAGNPNFQPAHCPQ